jgi:lambda family phage portal protein
MQDEINQTGNILEKTIAFFSPGAALERAEQRAALNIIYGVGGFQSAMPSSERDGAQMLLMGNMDLDSFLQWQKPRMTAELRDLQYNSPILSSILKIYQDNVVGSGICPDPSTSDLEKNKLYKTWFHQWSNKFADLNNMRSFAELQKIILSELLVGGDCLVVLTNDANKMPRLQLVEGLQLQTPYDAMDVDNVFDGIKYGRNGNPIAYYICKRDKNGNIDRNDYDIVSANDAIFISSPYLRPSQRRGAAILANVANAIRDWTELEQAQLTKAKVAAMHIFTRTRDGQPGRAPQIGKDGKVIKATGPEPELQLRNGAILNLKQGEGFNLVNGNTPGATHEAFSMELLRIIATGSGLPVEILLRDSQKNEGNRAILMQSARVFETYQKHLERHFDRIYGYVIATAIKQGFIPAAPVEKTFDGVSVSEFAKVSWIYPSKAYIEDKDIASQMQTEFLLGTTNLKNIADARGEDWEENLEEKGNEFLFAIKLAQRITKETGFNVSPYDLLSPQPGSTHVNLLAENNKQKETP